MYYSIEHARVQMLHYFGNCIEILFIFSLLLKISSIDMSVEHVLDSIVFLFPNHIMLQPIFQLFISFNGEKIPFIRQYY